MTENNKQKDDMSIDVASVAALARLKIDESEIQQLQEEMNNIVSYVNQLSELDLENIEPTIHAAVLNNIWREDESVKGNFTDDILKNAPSVIDDGLIRVPQVVSGDSES
ncbi:MAG TPA: Asp-tRNA(Asn)/Glu-tRNA(Gln) amidotransferase subunit GatC [Victivallales bacterium]|nr:Asp-tRNA(Asn)/Glu-tRNA(Gln) amidotransferase subunit GatC [Victivallales bacterium]